MMRWQKMGLHGRRRAWQSVGMIRQSAIIDALHQAMQALARQHVAACAADGLDILIYCGLRSEAEQAALYAAGRTRKGRIITHAQPGQSPHQYGLAYDFVPILHSKCQWQNTAMYRRAGELAEALGLEWGGRWPEPKTDAPHCQMVGWRTIAGIE